MFLKKNIIDRFPDGMFPSVFYKKLKNIYWKCHNHQRLHKRKHFVGILLRVEKYLLQMP